MEEVKREVHESRSLVGMKDPEVVNKWVDCPKSGHRIRLEVISGSPNRIQRIECPTCHTEMIVIAGDLKGVFSDDPQNPKL